MVSFSSSSAPEKRAIFSSPRSLTAEPLRTVTFPMVELHRYKGNNKVIKSAKRIKILEI